MRPGGCFVVDVYAPDFELVREPIAPMDTRYTFRYELLWLLERAGFEVVDVYRDYDRQPYDGTGEIITVARRPKPGGERT